MKDLKSIRFLFLEMYFAIQDNAWGFWLDLRQILFIWYLNETLVYFKQFLTIAAFNHGTSDIYWNKLIRRNTQMTFRCICFQAVRTEPFKHCMYTYLKVIHDFIRCTSTIVGSGIISKVCSVGTVVFKKQITKIYVKQQRLKYRSLRYTINV